MYEKLGVFGQVLIKKHGSNWPKGVPGDQIDEHFADKPTLQTSLLNTVKHCTLKLKVSRCLFTA